MKKEKRNVLKSFRCSETIYNYIIDYNKNSNFNSNLENMILYLMENEKMMKAREKVFKDNLQRLSKEIEKKETALNSLNHDVIRSIDKIKNSLEKIKYS